MEKMLIQTNSLKKNDILSILGSEEVYNLQKRYPNRKIGFYILFGEGKYGYQTGEGSISEIYVNKDMVIRSYRLLQNEFGFVYDRHPTPSEIFSNVDNRVPIGEIVGYYLRNINGKSYIIASAIFDKNINLENDYKNASLEGLLIGNNNSINAIKIKDFAIFEENENLRQLYSDAGLIYTIMSYKDNKVFSSIEKVETKKQEEQESTNTKRSENMNISFEDVKRYIRDNKIYPSQLFDSNSILGLINVNEKGIEFEGGDPNITSIIKKKLKDKVFVDSEKYTNYEKLEKEYEKIKPEFIAYKTMEFRNRAKEDIFKKSKELNIDDKLLKFLTSEKSLNKISYSEDKDYEKMLNDYLKDSTEYYKEIEKIFKEEEKNETKENKSDKPFL